MKKGVLTGLLIFSGFLIWGQTISDALRYSTVEFGATGRAFGAANSFSALGADFSLISANPAGLAAFRKSEFVITPGFFSEKTEADLLNGGLEPYDENKSNFNLSNLGVVLRGRPNASHWRTANFSIGLNRLATFHQEFYFNGATRGSITDRWLELATGLSANDLDGFEAGVAYDAGALIPSGIEGEYFTDFSQFSDIPVFKSQRYTSSGSINEFTIGMAGNYEDRIYAGIILGVPFVNYNEEKVYEETDETDAIPAFNELEYTETLRTNGAGINAKAGIIYRVAQPVRIGLAVHTPTRLKLEDNFSTKLVYDYTDQNNDGPVEANSPDGNFEYNLITPWRFIGSAGFIFGKNGFISAEAEWVDYSSASFNFRNASSDDLDYERSVNRQIAETYKGAVNLRFGGELVWKVFRLRGGVALNGSPYAGESDFTPVYSAGVGLREERFFMDFGYRWSNFEEGYYPYRTNSARTQFVQNQVSTDNFVLTFGFKM